MEQWVQQRNEEGHIKYVCVFVLCGRGGINRSAGRSAQYHLSSIIGDVLHRRVCSLSLFSVAPSLLLSTTCPISAVRRTAVPAIAVLMDSHLTRSDIPICHFIFLHFYVAIGGATTSALFRSCDRSSLLSHISPEGFSRKTRQKADEASGKRNTQAV